jgi:preprotein translocase SecE subunit
MGRALRRQQERAARRQQRQQQRSPSGGGRPPVSVSGPATAEARRGGRRWVPRWISDIFSELRKVTWPTRHEVGYLTVVVIIVSAFFGAILGLADLGFNWIIENTVLR